MSASPRFRRALAALSLAAHGHLAAEARAQTPAPAVPDTAPPVVRRVEVIRGRVMGDSVAPLPDADVIATMAPDREIFRTRTDSSGRYELVIAQGTGDYLLHISAPGRAAFRRRVTRKAPTDSVFVVDATLPLAGVQQLATVRVEARRERPSRSTGTSMSTGTGNAETLTGSGVNGQLSPAEQGDLAAMAATVPGVIGGTVLGAGADQNQTTLNGMAFAGAELPRDARTMTRFATSAYDPARGGFSGAQIAVELAPGGTFGGRRAHLTLDAPALQATDAVGERLGQRFTRVDASIGGDGEIVMNEWFYNASAQLRRNIADATSIHAAGDEVLTAAGAHPDSVARFLQLIGAAVPPVTGAIPSDRLQTSVTAIGRIDRQPRDPKQTWGVTGYARYGKSEALGFAPTSTPTHGGEQTAATLTGQGAWSRYIGAAGLTELRSALTLQRDASTPYARLPEGRVLVSSAEGAAGTPLVFGGNAGLDFENSQWTWETTSETQYVPKRRQLHRLKLYAQSRLDGVTQQRPGNRFGAYTFNSLADFEAGRAERFTRTLGSPDREGGQWSGALAAGDRWRATPKLSVEYGLRGEANAFTARPAYNPDVQQRFGARTDHAPNTMHVSPRLGFTWVYAGEPNMSGVSMSQLATTYFGPRAVVRGGIGEFRGLLPAGLLGQASVNTGLPGGARRLVCIGDAVPAADWDAFAASAASIPDQCADGAGALADTAPAVVLYGRDYAPPRSWRANLGWTSRISRLGYAVEAVGSYNVDQPSLTDLNFAGVPRFTLADEGDRPVFVSPAAIVAATGASSPAEARRFAEYGPVSQLRSDNRSRGAQLSLVVTPDVGDGRLFLRGAYVLGVTRALQRGYDGATFGDPRRHEWARGDQDARHQFQLQAGVSWKGLALTSFTRVTSGLPYTPRVAGDVNGDGNGFNDRAFIFAEGAPIASDLAALMAGGPRGARECLLAQRGRAAGRNSCQGPLTAAMNAQLTVPGRWLGIGRRNNVSLYFSNPLGGIDQLLHGERGLRGWGTSAIPDPVLYRVTGFDHASGRFRYEVNPRFGSTSPSRTTLRAPFRVTLDVSLNIGRPLEVQQLDRWLKPGRNGRPGTRLGVDTLVARYRRNVPDFYDRILRETDSLLVTPPQAEALRAAQLVYRQQMDSVWRELAVHLASLGDTYDAAAALKRQEAAVDSAWDLSWRNARAELPKILNPLQLKLLPWPADMLYKAKEPIRGVRVYMSGP